MSGIQGNDPQNTKQIGNTLYPTNVGDNAGNENAWSWGVLNRHGVALLGNNPIQGNTPFQHEDKFVFSPFPTNPLSMEGLALAAILINFSRSSEGQKTIERISTRYMESITKILVAIEDCGVSNWANAGMAQTLAAAVMHKSGMIDDAGYIKTIDHVRSVFDKMWEKDLIGSSLAGISTLVKSTGGAVPAILGKP